jgi:hypothetical protein
MLFPVAHSRSWNNESFPYLSPYLHGPHSTCSCVCRHPYHPAPTALCFKPNSIKVNNNTRTELTPIGEYGAKGLVASGATRDICPLKFPGEKGSL